KRVGSTTPATRTAKRSRKTMVASLSMPYATSARAKNCLTIINSKWTNRSRARSKLRMHAIVAAQIAAALCLIQVVNADLPSPVAQLALRGRLFLETCFVLSTPISKLVHVASYQGRISGGGPPE